MRKPPQKPRNVETAAKKPEQTRGGEDTEERPPGEEGGPAEQEDKVRYEIQHQCLKCAICLVMLTKLPACLISVLFLYRTGYHE